MQLFQVDATAVTYLQTHYAGMLLQLPHSIVNTITGHEYSKRLGEAYCSVHNLHSCVLLLHATRN